MCTVTRDSQKDIRYSETSVVNCSVVNLAPTAEGHSQKKDVSPIVVNCFQQKELKYMKDVSCVTQLSFVKPVTNVQAESFWKTGEALGAGPKVLNIFKQGYILPFRTRPNLKRSPTVISCYVNSHRNLYLLEALHQLMTKNAVEPVQNQKSLGFFN